MMLEEKYETKNAMEKKKSNVNLRQKLNEIHLCFILGCIYNQTQISHE